MFAIVEVGGKQYLVKEKDYLRLEKLGIEEGKTTSINKVLLVSSDSATKVGTPYLPSATVELKVLKTALGDKVITFKMKSKKRYKRSKNHRQPFTDAQVLSIKG